MTALEARKNIAALKAGILIRHERFWPRLCLASVMSGPLNPVGIIASLWFLQTGVEGMFVALVAINSYCTVATLFAAVAVAISLQDWTEKRLMRLGLSIMAWLYAITCFLGLLTTGPAVVVFIFFGLILAIIIGAPAAIFGTTLFQLIVFKRP